MTIVTMPDGVPVDFGDMPPDQIKTLIQKKFPDFGKPPPETPWYGDEPGIAAKVLQGFGSIATGIDDVMSGRVDPKSDEGIANITDAAALTTPVSPAARAGYGWMGAKIKPKTTANVPTGKELLETGGFGFDMARGMDVRYTTKAVQNMAVKLQSQLHKAGFRESNAPEAFAELKNLLKPAEPGAFATIDDLHAVRQALGKAAQNFNKPADQDAAVQIIKSIDKFISEPDPASVVAGPAAGAGNVWSDAMGNYAAGKRSDRLVDKPTSLEVKAERRASASNSGLNKDNTIRQRVASLLENPKTRSGFNTEEIALLETVADGTAARNVTRFVGNLLGGGGGLGAMLTGVGTGLALGSGVPAAIGTIPVGIGVASKMLGSGLTKNALNKVATTTRQRSPLYQQRVETAPPALQASPAARSMMGRPVAGVAPAAVSLMETLEKQQITPQQYEEYLRQKYARDQGA